MNPRIEQFAKLYLKYKNATKAAIEAGYSEKTARSQASKLLNREDVKEYLEELGAKDAEVLDLNRRKILEVYKEYALSKDKKVPVSERIKSADRLMEHLFPTNEKGEVTKTKTKVTIDGIEIEL